MNNEFSPRGIAEKLQIGKIEDKIIHSPAGSELRIQQTGTKFSVSDENNAKFFFIAKVRSSGKLTFDVCTKDALGQHHPDLYARDLYTAAIAHFASLGIDTSKVKSMWIPEDGMADNFLQYQRGQTVEEKKEHATLTPEGRVLTALGYKPEWVEDSRKKEVVVQWVK